MVYNATATATTHQSSTVGKERSARMFCLCDSVVVVARVWILSVCPPSVSCSHFVCSTGTSTTGRALSLYDGWISSCACTRIEGARRLRNRKLG